MAQLKATGITGSLEVINEYITGSITGSDAKFTSLTASSIQGTVVGGVTTSNISSYATTGVTAGTGLSGGGTVGTLTLDLDFSELTDKTTDIVGTTEFILQDGTTESRKAASEIKLSFFNNDSGWTSNTGDITSVVAGNGLTGGATSGDATLTVGAGTGITVNASDVAINTSVVPTLSAANTFTSRNTFANITVDTTLLKSDSSNDAVEVGDASTSNGSPATLRIKCGTDRNDGLHLYRYDSTSNQWYVWQDLSNNLFFEHYQTTGTKAIHFTQNADIHLSGNIVGSTTSTFNGASSKVNIGLDNFTNDTGYIPMSLGTHTGNAEFTVDGGFYFNPSTNTLTVTNVAGTATNATNVSTAIDSTANAERYVAYATSLGGNQSLGLDGGFTFNPSTNTLTTTNFAGAFSGDGSSVTNIDTSNITDFTTDVRAQFSAGSGITITDGEIAAGAAGTTTYQSDITFSSSFEQIFTNNGTSAQIGSTAAIEFNNKIFLFAGLPLSASNGTESGEVLYVTSSNNGTTWSNPVSISGNSTYDRIARELEVVEFKGKLYLFASGPDTYESPYFHGIVCMATSSDGNTWSSFVDVKRHNGAYEGFGSSMKVIVDPDTGVFNMYVGANGSPGYGYTGFVMHLTSSDSGSTWSTGYKIAEETSSNGFGTALDAVRASDGTYHMVVSAPDENSNKGSIYVLTSSNGTSGSWSAPIKIHSSSYGAPYAGKGLGGHFVGIEEYGDKIYTFTSHVYYDTATSNVGALEMIASRDGKTWDASDYTSGTSFTRLYTGSVANDYIGSNYDDSFSAPSLHNRAPFDTIVAGDGIYWALGSSAKNVNGVTDSGELAIGKVTSTSDYSLITTYTTSSANYGLGGMVAMYKDVEKIYTAFTNKSSANDYGLFFTSASIDQESVVSINKQVPSKAQFAVDGIADLGTVRYKNQKYLSGTGNLGDLSPYYNVYIFNPTSSASATLPPALANKGIIIRLFNMSTSNSVTINAYSGDTFGVDGTTSRTLGTATGNQFGWYSFMSLGEFGWATI